MSLCNLLSIMGSLHPVKCGRENGYFQLLSLVSVAQLVDMMQHCLLVTASMTTYMDGVY